jgi:hypothetical protein
MARPNENAAKEIEQTYHEWLDEALARDEQTWTAVEQQLRRLRLKRAEGAVPEKSAG